MRREEGRKKEGRKERDLGRGILSYMYGGLRARQLTFFYIYRIQNTDAD